MRTKEAQKNIMRGIKDVESYLKHIKAIEEQMKGTLLILCDTWQKLEDQDQIVKADDVFPY